MASEVTQRQRAEAVVNTVKAELPPIWLGGRQRMILVDEIEQALTTARQEALREACKLVNDYNCMHNHGKKATKACDDILEQLDRLTREGVTG